VGRAGSKYKRNSMRGSREHEAPAAFRLSGHDRPCFVPISPHVQSYLDGLPRSLFLEAQSLMEMMVFQKRRPPDARNVRKPLLGWSLVKTRRRDITLYFALDYAQAVLVPVHVTIGGNKAVSDREAWRHFVNLTEERGSTVRA
jgi:hypothetical protein